MIKCIINLMILLLIININTRALDTLFDAPINYSTGFHPISAFSSDFDNDGDYDLSVMNSSSKNVSILFNLTNTPVYCLGIRGNIDGDESDMIDIADLVYFVDYSFGTPP